LELQKANLVAEGTGVFLLLAIVLAQTASDEKSWLSAQRKRGLLLGCEIVRSVSPRSG